jgi:hypothetical protein
MANIVMTMMASEVIAALPMPGLCLEDSPNLPVAIFLVISGGGT